MTSATDTQVEPVSVVIVTRDRPDTLRQCIESIIPQLGKQDEIVIIAGSDESCPSELLDATSKMVSLRLGKCPDANISIARNMGLDLAEYDLVLFIDDDALACAGWVEAYRQSIQEHTDACIAGGDVLDARTEPMEFEFRNGLIHPSGRQIEVRNHPSEPVPRGYRASVKGCNFGIHRGRAPIEVRFDTFFRFAFDETDLMMSILEAGGESIQIADALVEHLHAPGIYRASSPMDRDWRTEFASHTMFMRKHSRGLDRVTGWGVISARLCKHILRGMTHALCGQCSPALSYRAFRDAIRGIRFAATQSRDNA